MRAAATGCSQRDAARQAYERLGGYSLHLYLTGDWESAMTVAREAVRTGRERGDTHDVLWSMPHLAMAAAAAGRYDDAIVIFRDARRFGEEYELTAALPRCIAMSAGFHLDLFDFLGAEAISEEARDLGQTYFKPSVVSSGIDLLFNYARRGEPGRAETLIDQVGEDVVQGGGWHGWLWRLRFTQVQAELAAARGDHEWALERATDAIAQSRSKRRVKYESYGLVTRARSLVALGRTADAVVDLRTAMAKVSDASSPTLQLVVGSALIEFEPDDSVVSWARTALDQVLASLNEPELRDRFLAADAVRKIQSA